MCFKCWCIFLEKCTFHQCLCFYEMKCNSICGYLLLANCFFCKWLSLRAHLGFVYAYFPLCLTGVYKIRRIGTPASASVAPIVVSNHRYKGFACIHSHAHFHAHTHAHSHAHIHTHTCTHINIACSHTFILARTRSHAHKHDVHLQLNYARSRIYHWSQF